MFQNIKKTIPVHCKGNRQVRAKLQQFQSKYLLKYFPDRYIFIPVCLHKYIWANEIGMVKFLCDTHLKIEVLCDTHLKIENGHVKAWAAKWNKSER